MARRAVLHDDRRGYERLARVYKQINTPVGELGLQTLAQATKAIKGGDTGYSAWLTFVDELTSQRDALVAEIKTVLHEAVFGGQRLDDARAERLARRAEALLGRHVDEGDED